MSIVNDIHFSASLLAEGNEDVNQLSLSIQFKASIMSQWETLIKKLSPEKGQLAAFYDIPDRILKSMKELRAFREIVEAGGTPDLRLIMDSVKEEEVTHIVVQSGESYVEKGTLHFNFHDAWLIDRLRWSKLPLVNKKYEKCKQVAKVDFPETEQKEEVALLKRQLEEKQVAETQLKKKLEVEVKKVGTLETEQVKMVADIQKMYVTAQNELDVMKTSEKETSETINKLTVEKGSLEETIKLNVEEIDQLYLSIKKKDEQISSKDRQIQSLEEEVIALNDELKEQEKQSTKDDQVVVDYQAKARPASMVYTSVVQEVERAQVDTAASGYKLANVSLNLKTVVEQDDSGFRFQLVDEKNAAQLNPDAISTVTMQIIDDKATSNTIDKKPNEGMPSVLGLTETACRKRLKAFGLRLNPVYEYNANKVLGQAFRQSPVAGEEYVTNQVITVVFSKNK